MKGAEVSEGREGLKGLKGVKGLKGSERKAFFVSFTYFSVASGEPWGA